MDDLLEVLSREETLRGIGGNYRTMSDISDDLGISAATAHRVTKTLKENNLVKETNHGLMRTEKGDMFLSLLDEFKIGVQGLNQCERFLDILPLDIIHVRDLRDAEIHSPSTDNPLAPLIRLAEVTSSANHARVLSREIEPHSFDVALNGVRNGDQRVEVVLGETAADTVRDSEWYGDKLEKDLNLESLSVFVHEDPGYNLGVLDEIVCIGEKSNVDGVGDVIETDNEDIRDWALSVFHDTQDESVPAEEYYSF